MLELQAQYEESVPLGVKVHDKSLLLERPLSVEEIEDIVDAYVKEEEMMEEGRIIEALSEESFQEAMQSRAEVAREVARIERGEEEKIEGLMGLARDRKEVIRELALEEVEKRRRNQWNKKN